jgi:hypothetical protein
MSIFELPLLPFLFRRLLLRFYLRLGLLRVEMKEEKKAVI